MKRWLILLIYLFIFIIIKAEVFAKDITYSTSEVERPVTIPKNVWELYAGSGYARWNGSRSIVPAFNFRYGITDNLEFQLLGLKYRFFESDDGLEASIKGMVVGYSTIEGIIWGSSVEVKQRLNERLALNYKLEGLFSGALRNQLMPAIGGIFQIGDKLAFSLEGNYIRQFGDDNSESYGISPILKYNRSSRFDMWLVTSFTNNLQGKVSLFLPYKEFYGLIMVFRF